LRRFLSLAALAVLLAGCGSSVASSPSETPTPSSTPAPTSSPKAKPSPTLANPYPPHSVTDLKALARSATVELRAFKSEGTGLPSCTEPKDSVVVPAGLTGQPLAASLMKLFYGNGRDNNCGSLILGYHDQSEYGQAYTAGRVDLTILSGGKHEITLDVGQDEYVIDY
jgi:hypothetical protein